MENNSNSGNQKSPTKEQLIDYIEALDGQKPVLNFNKKGLIMKNSGEPRVVDILGEACNDFASVARTIKLLEGYMASPANPLPPDKTEEELNHVKAALTILLSFSMQEIQDLSKELPQG